MLWLFWASPFCKGAQKGRAFATRFFCRLLSGAEARQKRAQAMPQSLTQWYR